MSDYGVTDLQTALSQHLPFKIPVIDPLWAQRYPEVFVPQRCTYYNCVDTLLRYNFDCISETSVTSLDQNWVNIAQKCCPGLVVYLNQQDSSDAVKLRHETTMMLNGALVLIGVAKLSAQEMEVAKSELVDKFFPDAQRLFPTDQPSVIGICTSATLISLYEIVCLGAAFDTRLHRSYIMTVERDRVDFIVDFFKILRWVATVSGPNSPFHLIPAVRLRTPNKHFITWLKEGILKEYHRPRAGMIERMQHVYALHLPHVEHGEAYPNTMSVLISRVGTRLSSALRLGMISKDAIIHDVERGLEELHNAGYAHCDLVIENVFVDKDGAFLDDFEYITPINDPPPETSRWSPSQFPNLTAVELDHQLLSRFKTDILRLNG